MTDRDAVMFLFGVCFALVLYRLTDDITDVIDAMRRPRVEWHVFGQDTSGDGPTAGGKDATASAPMYADNAGAASAPAGTSGHVKVSRP